MLCGKVIGARALQTHTVCEQTCSVAKPLAELERACSVVGHSIFHKAIQSRKSNNSQVDTNQLFFCRLECWPQARKEYVPCAGASNDTSDTTLPQEPTELVAIDYYAFLQTHGVHLNQKTPIISEDPRSPVDPVEAQIDTQDDSKQDSTARKISYLDHELFWSAYLLKFEPLYTV